MAKDPAFSFYAQDYLVDTFQWDRGSKSLHVDLLAISWINGFIEADQDGAPVGLTDEDKQLWNARVKHKWELKGGKLFNSRLEDGRQKRKKFLAGQSEKGRKSASKRTESQPDSNHGSTVVQPGFNHLKSEKENEKEIENEFQEGGAGETKFSGIVPDMLEQFIEVNPEYPVEQEIDFPAIREIAVKVLKWEKLKGDIVVPQNSGIIKRRWGELVGFIKADSHFSGYSLTRINKHFQSIVQSFNHGTTSAHRGSATGSGEKPGTSKARIKRASEW